MNEIRWTVRQDGKLKLPRRGDGVLLKVKGAKIVEPQMYCVENDMDWCEKKDALVKRGIKFVGAYTDSDECEIEYMPDQVEAWARWPKPPEEIA